MNDDNNDLTTEKQILDIKLRRNLLWLLRLLIIGAVVGLLLWARPLIASLLSLLAPFLVAFIIAYVFNPVVRILQYRLHLGRAPALAVTYAIILSIGIAVLWLLLPTVYTQARDAIAALVDNIPLIAKKFNEWFRLRIDEKDIESVRSIIGGILESSRDKANPGSRIIAGGTWAMRILAEFAQWASMTVVVVASGTVKAVTFACFAIMISVYFLLDYSGLWQRARMIIPPKHDTRVVDIARKVDHALGGYLRGQLTVCIIMAICYTIALWCLGLRTHAVLIGLLAGFGNLIPYFGPIVGAVPTILWIVFGNTYDDVSSKMFGIFGVLLLTVVLQSLDGWVFQPKIVGANADLPPLLVLLALLVGVQFGLIGMILAVPSAVVLRALIIEIWWNPLIAEAQAAGLPTPKESKPRVK